MDTPPWRPPRRQQAHRHTSERWWDNNSRSGLCPTMRQSRRHKMCYFRFLLRPCWCVRQPFGILPGTSANPGLDSTVKASGNSSLKFTIPSQSGGNAGGAYFTNFSNDLSTQFGENSDFYIQWRQRFSPEMISIIFQAAGGGAASWKQSIIGTGDQPGCTPYSGSPPCYSLMQRHGSDDDK